LGNRPPTVKAERRLAWKNEERVGQLRPSQFSQTIYTVPKQLKGRERESHNKLKAQIWGLVYQEKSSNVRPPPFSIDCR
jgi:hypothetical protein